ncbi:MAG TPA: Maf family protein, partial [Gemmatimonadales bacterium]|nr:Maf family protein [Gemmatimonadales bacterium]
MTIPLILASVSPRRRELLRLLGLSAEVVPADLDESWKPGELPHDHAERLARAKVAAIASRRPEAAVVGADTIVVV